MSIVILSSDTCTFSKEERSELFEIMRDAYARTETEIWGENYLRMPHSEYETLIDQGTISAAVLDEKIVGSIHSRKLDDESFTFSLLAVHRDFGGRGIGRKLIEAVEEKARKEGLSYSSVTKPHYMKIEILRPRDFRVPTKVRLRTWYEGMGYVFTHNQNFQDRRPDRAKDLMVPSVFDCYRKELFE